MRAPSCVALFLVPSVVVVVASCSQGSSGQGATPGGAQEAGSDGGGSSGASGSSGGGGGSSGSGGSSSGSGSGGSSGGGSSSGGSSGGGGDGSAGGACSKGSAACVCDNTGCNVGSYYLYDNQWNCGAGSGNTCGAESAYGCASADGTVSFVVTSNQPAGNTAVLTYPAVQDNFSKLALGSFKSITSTFDESSPHVGDYEVAWDCWFNAQKNEVMVWVDDYNQVPGGTKVKSGVSLGGRSWDVWWGPSTGTGGYLAFEATTSFTSGTVDLLLLFQYAATNGWLPADSDVEQISFGVEVCSTGGQDATWTFDAYSVTAN